MAETSSDNQDLIPTDQRLNEVRVFDGSGQDGQDNSRVFNDFVNEAAEVVLKQSGLELSAGEAARWTGFAQIVGERALEAMSDYMGVKGWMRFSYSPDMDDEGNDMVTFDRIYELTETIPPDFEPEA